MYSTVASILANEYATSAFLLVAGGSAFLLSHFQLQLQLDKTIVTGSAARIRKRLGLSWGSIASISIVANVKIDI